MKTFELSKNPASHALKVAAHFSKAAIAYESSAQLQKSIADHLISKLDLNLAAKHILDLGCGTAYLHNTLKSFFPKAKCYSLDISLAMLQQAKQKNSLICGNMEQLPLSDQSIDLLFANMSLQWSTDLAKNFAEIKRILKPKGRCLISLPGPMTLNELKRSWAAVDQHSHVNEFPSSLLLHQQLHQLGFKDIKISEKTFDLEHSSVIELMRYLKRTGTDCVLHSRNTLTGKHKFQAMVKHYEQLRKANGFLPCTYQIIFIETSL